MKLNLYLPYIASNAYVNKYDNDLNGMSYYEIAEQFRPMYTQDAEKSRKNSYGKQHAVNNAYTIVRVPDLRQLLNMENIQAGVLHIVILHIIHIQVGVADYFILLKERF